MQCPHPNRAVANCWFMMRKRSARTACVHLLMRYLYSAHSCDSKSRNIYFTSHLKQTVHHQPTLLRNKIPTPSTRTVPTQPIGSYSIMEGSLVSRIWSVRIQGMDISMGNWMRRPMVSSRKNSRNQSWDRSQHCCSASEIQRRSPQREGTHVTPTGMAVREGHKRQLLQPHVGQVLGGEHFSGMSPFLNLDHVHAVWALCNGRTKKGSFLLL